MEVELCREGCGRPRYKKMTRCRPCYSAHRAAKQGPCTMCGNPGYSRGLCVACYDRELTSGRLKRLRDKPKTRYCERGDACMNADKHIEKRFTYRNNLCRSCYEKDMRSRQTPEQRERKRKTNRAYKERVKTPGPQQLIETEEEVGNYVEPGAASGVADDLGQLGPWDEVEGLVDGGPGGAAADGIPDRRTGERAVKRVEPVPTDLVAVQWGPSWDAMMKAAEQLGEAGMLFDIKFASEEDRRRGVEIFPELHIMDSRFRNHVVTHGLWVVIYPGFRQFRVLSTEELEAQYKETA